MVESAAYFVVFEAIVNAVKYGEGDGLTVTLERSDGIARIAVHDHGCGSVRVDGDGVRGMVDRVAALDGTLTVDARPGTGTLVEAVIPCSAPAGDRDVPSLEAARRCTRSSGGRVWSSHESWSGVAGSSRGRRNG